jgi:hypothetical protein
MADDIIEWLSDNEKWLSHMGTDARGVGRLDHGLISSIGARGADRLG